MLVHKAYKVRLYPNKAQEAELLHILSACRWIWNYFLEKRNAHYFETKTSLKYLGMAKELTKLRATQPELQGVHSAPAHQSLRRLESTYSRFFRKLGGLPRFKTEFDIKQSFQKNKDWKIVGDKIKIQDSLVIKTRGNLPGNVEKIGTLIVGYTAGRWYASITTKEAIKPHKRHTKAIGIDVGLTNLAVSSDGRKFPTLKPGYSLHHRMRILQQKMARQEMGSNRREETRKKIAKLYHKMANIRENHLHQTSHAILEKRPSMIAIESLNVLGMMKNRHLSRSLADVSLGELHRQLKYKQIWNGGKVVEIDTFFPSTKTCSECGVINEKMTLATRNWTCLGCGAEHDRDINAAKNILRQGLGKPRVEKPRGFVEAQTALGQIPK